MKAFVRMCVAMIPMISAGWAQDAAGLRKERDDLAERGLWKEAAAFYREKLSGISDGGSGDDLEKAASALGRLNEPKSVDGLVEGAVEAHPGNPALLLGAAGAYAGATKWGAIVAGEFERGYPRGMNQIMMDVSYRDRVRRIQLILAALERKPDEPVKSRAWQDLAAALRTSESWKLQVLTPLDVLPAWEDRGPSGGTEGAPWSKDGPVLYSAPASWEMTKNDGERWRFALAELAKCGPAWAAAATLELARFSEGEFGAGTLLNSGWWRPRDAEDSKGILELEGLGDDEVLAKTSDGVRRFKLPPDQHFIALYRSVMEMPERGGEAGDALVMVYLGRHQFAKARETLEDVIGRFGAGPEDSRKRLLGQITGNWGRFGVTATVPAGTKPVLPLYFRNAKTVKFKASPVDMDGVLADTIGYLKGNPLEIEWDRLNPSAVASRIVEEKQSKYVGAVAAEWVKELQPAEAYRDKREDIGMPLDKAGAWWVTAEIENGNTFHTLVWIVDTLLVCRDVGDNKQWWVTDAETGAPVEGARVEFFGYRTEGRDRKTPQERRFDVVTGSFGGATDGDGKLLVKPGDLETKDQWMAYARKDGRMTAFFGFRPLSFDQPRFDNGNRDLGYGITDRPLYKPGDTLHVKFYLRNVGYFEPDEAKYANRTGSLSLFNGRGEEVAKISDLKTDELGAVEAEAVIPKDAVLGRWQAVFSIPNEMAGSVAFQVEEFRKPEYEVSVEAPAEPVRLGGKFSATVKAAYFHGAPVRDAEVEIIVKRSPLQQRWFPAGRWDWLYGKGAWWPGTDAAWHPEWNSWRCDPPEGGGGRWTPEEMVMRETVKIGADGTAKVEIDTAQAKERHGDLDARYVIEARVTDASRREEKATGEVIAARKPFELVVWPVKGFAAPGEDAEIRVSAATLSGKPVAGAEGTLKLFKLSVNAEGKVEEKEVLSWPLKTDGAGLAFQRFAAPETGQYRAAATLSPQGEEVSAATILNVHGPGKAEVADWKFGALELIADKTEYAAGDTLKLRVNSDRAGAHVWLFLHIGRAGSPETRRVVLDGKSLEVEVPLDRRDMPNMFVEAVTVFGAEIFTASKEILLPPEDKMVGVSVEAEKSRLGPGGKSSLRISLRDAAGNPVAGKAVLAVYDKALEAVTGGGNVPPIREAFWNWRNYYYEGSSSCSVPMSQGNLTDPQAEGMQIFAGGWGGDTFMERDGMAGGKSRMMAKSAPDAAAPAAFAEAAPAPAPAEAAAIQVRKDFADLLKWVGTVVTDADGRAEVPLEFPDNLTTWKARVWMLGSGTRVGEGSAEIITTKDLLVRLQAPRFLVEKDEALLGAVVHNEHDVAKEVKVSLELEGDAVSGVETAPVTVTIPSKGEARVEWKVKAAKEGTAKVRMIARSDSDGDAVERDLPVRVNGMLRQDAWSRVLPDGTESAKFAIEVPKDLRPDESKLTVRFSPSAAGAVVDAIPYLASYPYGCTEQTLNRFLPAVIAQRTLAEMNIDLAAVKLKRTNLNPQELGDAAARAEQWRQWKENPVFDEGVLSGMVDEGIKRLASMQNQDGGWGWFSGYGERSYPHTTAVVMHGLLAGRVAEAGKGDVMYSKGLDWLSGYEEKEVEALKRHAERQEQIAKGGKPEPATAPEKGKADALDAFVREVLGRAGKENGAMTGFLFRDRVDLPVYAQVLLGLELNRLKDGARRDEVILLVSQFIKRDAENQTAYLDETNGSYRWYWYGSGIEANAWHLKLLSAVDPGGEDARELAKYLVNNRKGGSHWDSTRDTAFAVEALCAYLKASDELAPEMEVEVLMDGKRIGGAAINKDNLFSFDGTVSLQGKAVEAGKHEIEIRRTGKGPVYANAYLEVFSLEDRLRAAGLEVKVRRNISKISEKNVEGMTPDRTGQVVVQDEERLKREPLADGAVLRPGERIEVELVLESKNDYEYLIFSDPKAAGFETLEALSGYVPGAGLAAYMEPRDRTVDFFIRSLPRGKHVLRYQLRAETPGTYKALPAEAAAMYAPELRGNSDDVRLRVRE